MSTIHQSYIFELWKSEKKYWISMQEYPWSILVVIIISTIVVTTVIIIADTSEN